jgi:hypothetical protein
MSPFMEIFLCERAIKDDDDDDVGLHRLLFNTEKLSTAKMPL